MNTVFYRNTRNIIIMDSSYSVLGMGKARPAGHALVGGVWFFVSGWTKCPEVGTVCHQSFFSSHPPKRHLKLSGEMNALPRHM